MKMLLVDDHALFRAGLRSLLQSRYPDAELVEAADGAAALSRAEELKPDLVILDLHLPDQDGLDVCAQLKSRLPSAKIIILSGDLNLAYLDRALEIGAMGYLLKLCTPEELPLAVDAVLAGKIYLCQDVNGEVLRRYREGLAGAPPSAKSRLSARELEVLRLVADGLRSKEIADRLQVGVKTVETYRRRLAQKLECDSTAELVRYAMREGIIQP